jgi:hypothetical protein
LHDVLALDATRRARFAFESRRDLFGSGVRAIDHFDGDAFADLDVLSFVDGAHAAAAEQPLHQVFAGERRANERFGHSSQRYARTPILATERIQSALASNGVSCGAAPKQCAVHV